MDRIKPERTEHRRAVPVVGSVPVRTLLQACGRERREPRVDAAVGRAVHTDTVLWCAADDQWARKAGSPSQCETSASTDAANGPGSDLSQAAVVDAGTGTSDLSVPVAGAANRSSEPGMGNRSRSARKVPRLRKCVWPWSPIRPAHACRPPPDGRCAWTGRRARASDRKTLTTGGAAVGN